MLHVQWATDPVSAPIEFVAEDWATFPKLPLPEGGETIDASKGWVRAVFCQGLDPNGDHVAVDVIADGCKITAWNDDSGDWTADEFYATVWEIPTLHRDSAVGNRWNTRQRLTVYAAGARLENYQARTNWMTNPGAPVVVFPWSEFVPPSEAITRHGIWMPDALYAEAVSAVPRSLRNWRSSTEGVPAEDIKDGLVV